MYLMIVSFFLFVSLAFTFHKCLNKNKEKLSALESYGDVNWAAMYFDALTQFKILKSIIQGETKVEKKLKVILLAQGGAFLALFTSMSYFLLS